MGIIASLYGFITYVRSRATSAQKKQTIQLQATHSYSSSQIVPKSFSWMDWMQVLWLGFEDCFRARGGTGCMNAIFIGLGGALFIGLMASTPNAPKEVGTFFIVFVIAYALILLCFYAYFVGRRIDEKVDELNNP